MTEGDEPKPKSTPSQPPERAQALARKLTGGRAVPAALAKIPTDAPISPRPATDEEAAVSRREAVLAARRASVTPQHGDRTAPGAKRTESLPPPPRRRARTPFLVLGALLLVALFGGAGVYAQRALHERSDDGRVHSQLLAWEFAPRDPAVREAAFVEIDRMGPAAMALVVEKLTDEAIAEKGSSRSTHRIQQVAHLYLLHLAARAKVPPPKIADEIEKLIFEGAAPSAQQWTSARDAWRAWLSEQQAKGSLPQ